MDMYTRVKRTRRKIKRDMYGMPLVEEEEKSTEEETEEDGDEVSLLTHISSNLRKVFL